MNVLRCRVCLSILTKSDVTVEIMDEELWIRVCVKCPKCGHKMDAFVELEDLADAEE